MKNLFLLLVLLPFLSTGQTITTIIGDGTAGNTGFGVPATAARIYYPYGIVYHKGEVYFSENNDTSGYIRKIDASGTYLHFAGINTPGYSGDGGPATAAQFDGPVGLFFDKSGNLFIAEAGNSVIRKINTAGIISTVAGTGVGGYSGDNGPATNAKLNGPTSVKLDTAGNMYIADNLNNVVRKVNKYGIITTIAGTNVAGYSGDNKPATSAQLNWPSDIALDSSGNLYIADFTNQVIRMIDKRDTIHTVIGLPGGGFAGDSGPATAARLYGPWGIIFDSSWNLLITDGNNNRIRKVTPAGIITTVAGDGFGSTTSSGAFAGDGGPATAGELYTPSFCAVGAAGTFYIADENNSAIRKVDTSKPRNVLTVKQLTTESSQINIFPNPNNGSFNLKGVLSPMVDGTASVTIRNEAGFIIYQTNRFAQSGVINTQITLQKALPNGIYLVELKSSTARSSTFLIVER